MKKAEDLIPWKVTDISLRPYSGFWSFNPSIHFDGNLWRCSLRCADYCMLGGGETIRSSKAKPGASRTKNAMVIFEPDRWKPIEIYKIHEHDDLPRAPSGSVGYEDIRLFRTDKGGLQGIAAALHLRQPSRKQLAEQVLISFDENYDIVDANPIRGDWNNESQKNWAPFDHCIEPRFLYSIARGTLFGVRGPIVAAHALVRPSSAPARSDMPDERASRRARERALESENDRAKEERRRSKYDRKAPRRDVGNSAFGELRGGTQLVRIDDNAWLGIGHAMRFVDKLKYYHHVWYLVDDRGTMKAASHPMKLAPNNGIEFAAGLAIDGDRVVVSFGVDDGECRIGETSLSEVLGKLEPVKAEA